MLILGIKLDQTRAFPRRTHDVVLFVTFVGLVLSPDRRSWSSISIVTVGFVQVRSGLTCVWRDFWTGRDAPFFRPRASDVSHGSLSRHIPLHNTYPLVP